MLPLPRPVGIASDAERLIVEFTEPIPPDQLVDTLTRQAPAGITIGRATPLQGKNGTQPILARYRVETQPGEIRAIELAARRIQNFAPIQYQRYIHKESRFTTIDLFPYIDAVNLLEDGLEFALRITGGGSAKPAEICDILGIGDRHVNHRIRRLEVVWHSAKPTTKS